MKLYPAIDLRGGRVVRLTQGDYSRMTVYGEDPCAQARAFCAAGAKYLHVVDLDGAHMEFTKIDEAEVDARSTERAAEIWKSMYALAAPTNPERASLSHPETQGRTLVLREVTT